MEQWLISRRIQRQMTSQVRGDSTNCSHSLGCLLWCSVVLGNCGVLWKSSFCLNTLSLTKLLGSAFLWPGSTRKKVVFGWEICVCATRSGFSALSSANPCLTSPCWYYFNSEVAILDWVTLFYVKRKVSKQQLLIDQRHMLWFCTSSNWFLSIFLFSPLCVYLSIRISIAMYFQYGHKSEPPQELALCKAADVQQVLEGREQQGLFLFPGSSAWLPGRHCTAGWSQSASACASSTVL